MFPIQKKKKEKKKRKMHVQFRSLLSEITKPYKTLSETQKLHALVTRTHLSNDSFYATKIIRLYALNDDLNPARKLFDIAPQRTTFLWNSIIRAYAKSHEFPEAFCLFKQMLSSETKPDNFTFACVLRASSGSNALDVARIVHGGVLVSGLGLDSVCSSALVSAYSKLGHVDEARSVFSTIMRPDLVLWNAMITGYGTCGNWVKGLELLGGMRRAGEKPDGYTMVGLLMGLADPRLIEIGQVIHGFSIKSGFDSNGHVSSALVSMYSRCRCMDSACKVFDGIEQPDLVTSSALISGFSLAGDYVNALESFRKLTVEGRQVDPVLVASVLAASAQLAVVGPGCEIHGYVVRHGYGTELRVSSALIDMYAKCGFLEMGLRVLKTMPEKNIITYNSVIMSLGLYGLPFQAFQMFEEVLEKGFKPDETTFAALLCACCHSGLVNNGREYFGRMKGDFGIQATTEHYVYMVKLLGMAGELEEAYELVQSLPEPINSGIWGALLTCCDVHGSYELAEIVAQHLFEHEEEKSSYTVMLSNLHASDGRWNEVEKLRVDVGGVRKKLPGTSWIGSIT